VSEKYYHELKTNWKTNINHGHQEPLLAIESSLRIVPGQEGQVNTGSEEARESEKDGRKESTISKGVKRDGKKNTRLSTKIGL